MDYKTFRNVIEYNLLKDYLKYNEKYEYFLDKKILIPKQFECFRMLFYKKMIYTV